MSERSAIPTIVLGGTGYVAGELLRLIATHPQLALRAVASESQAGTPIREVFPHLQHSLAGQAFTDRATLTKILQDFAGEPVALFSAAPHGASAGLIAEILDVGHAAGCTLTVVDASADFRYSKAADYAAVYQHAHGAAALLADFACGLPEHMPNPSQPHIGHPGCFATAMLLGTVPLLSLKRVTPQIQAFGITGSTGSGRSPSPTTHHPFRHANLYAYNPLGHRHAPEVVGITQAITGVRTELNFIPHSGPFARGIYMTLQATLHEAVHADDLRTELAAFYAGHEFVEVVAGTPRLKDVVGSNYAHMGVTSAGHSVAVFIAIDNLLKGAAGGALQWMNIKLGLAENAGLTAAGPGWI